MKINIKQGVVFKEINDKYLQIFEALTLLPFKGYVPTITSGNDGTHLKNSYHYTNAALDVRVNDLPKDSWLTYRDVLQRRLGPKFQVILEKDHLHCEYDPI